MDVNPELPRIPDRSTTDKPQQRLASQAACASAEGATVPARRVTDLPADRACFEVGSVSAAHAPMDHGCKCRDTARDLP
jgi:hypothetical protein